MILLHEKLDNTRNIITTILIQRAEYILYKKQNLLLVRANKNVPTEAF